MAFSSLSLASFFLGDLYSKRALIDIFPSDLANPILK